MRLQAPRGSLAGNGPRRARFHCSDQRFAIGDGKAASVSWATLPSALQLTLGPRARVDLTWRVSIEADGDGGSLVSISVHGVASDTSSSERFLEACARRREEALLLGDLRHQTK